MQTPAVGVRLLGPVDVTIGGEPANLSGQRRKAVLAVLGLHAGEVVSSERIIDIVWGGSAPATVSNSLQNTIVHLRGLMGERSRIVTDSGGYALSLPPGALDLSLAESLVRAGRAGSDPRLRAVHLRDALALWRGSSLGDVSGVPWLAAQAGRLDQLRSDASVSLADARLALGEHAELVTELERTARANPFREDVQRQLMLALYRSGRQIEALTVFRRLRGAMLGELGIEPGPALRELEVAILRQDPRLDLAGPVVAAAGPSPAGTPSAGPPSAGTAPAGPVPAQLPHTPRAFTAREHELARLDAAAAAGLVIVHGTAGVGKTTLAVHWARTAAESFPDGQLYANLRGFGPPGEVARPADVLRGFLRALGIPARDVPADLDDQASLFRTMLAGRRVLVLLDNAKDEEQVRPLLAGGLVLITSRNRLPGLTIAEGARSVPLDLPSIGEARRILARHAGAERVDAEPDAVDDIIARCARLPLALAVAAARVTGGPAVLARELRELGEGVSPLEPFQSGEAATSVRAVLSWSYRALSPAAAGLFRRFGIAPTLPELSLAAVASLAGLPPARTRPLLDELIRANLLTTVSPDRFGCHDLLRAFAAERVFHEDDADDQNAAGQRLLDHYLHTAVAAARHYRPVRDPIAVAPAHDGVCVLEIPGPAAATAWFDSEQEALQTAVRPWVPPPFVWRPWQLAWALSPYLERQGRWAECAALHRAALQAARWSGDTFGCAHARAGLSRASLELGRPEGAGSSTTSAARSGSGSSGTRSRLPT